MSDVIEKVVDVVEAPEVVDVVVDPVVSQASEQGWVSKEEWVEQGKPADDWVSAKEFVRVGDIYKSLHQNKRELKQTQAQLDALRRHSQYIFEKAYNTAKDDLRKEKRSAIREGDLERLEEIETEMEVLAETHQKEKETIQAQQQVAQPNQEFQAFVDRNPWYVSEPTLKHEADFEGFKFLNSGGATDKLLQHVEQAMREKYPQKFGIKRAAPNPAAAVDRTARRGVTKEFELDEMETQMMNSLVSSGEMTKAEYVASLKKAKGIK